MEVILLERVEKLGQLGDVVTVKDGYARNYLLPEKKALRSTTEAHAQFKAEREKLEIENKSKKEGSAQLAEKMDGVQVVMVQQAGEGGTAVWVRNRSGYCICCIGVWLFCSPQPGNSGQTDQIFGDLCSTSATSC